MCVCVCVCVYIYIYIYIYMTRRRGGGGLGLVRVYLFAARDRRLGCGPTCWIGKEYGIFLYLACFANTFPLNVYEFLSYPGLTRRNTLFIFVWLRHRNMWISIQHVGVRPVGRLSCAVSCVLSVLGLDLPATACRFVVVFKGRDQVTPP